LVIKEKRIVLKVFSLPSNAGSPFRYDIMYLLANRFRALNKYHITIRKMATGWFKPLFSLLSSSELSSFPCGERVILSLSSSSLAASNVRKYRGIMELACDLFTC
jgi:hypothetical protein